jgi:tryptophan-rich sensory protein
MSSDNHATPAPSSRDGWTLALFVAVCLLAGAIGGIATSSSVETWYPGLRKPPWNPPAFVFGPVWTFLYITMGVSAWLVWRRRRDGSIRLPMTLFGLQLVLNTAWSLIFFGLRAPGLAALEIVLLWLAIAATAWSFARVSRAAAWLLAPYLAWVTFAVLLNGAIWRLNS